MKIHTPIRPLRVGKRALPLLWYSHCLCKVSCLPDVGVNKQKENCCYTGDGEPLG